MVKLVLAFILASAFTSAPAAEAVTLFLQGPYSFWPEGTEGDFILYRREAAPRGQLLYFVHDDYGGVRSSHMEDLYLGDQVLLENGDGVLHRATSAHVLCEQGVYEHSFSFVKYVFEGDFHGDLRLVVKLDDNWTVYSDLGPAAESRYRTGTVTAEGGAELKVAPTPDAANIMSIPRGERIYLTGRWEWFWVDPEDFFNWGSFSEAIYAGSSGWIPGDSYEGAGYKP